MKEVFNFLSTISEKNRDVNLIIDALSIKDQLEKDKLREEFVGFADYGSVNIETPATKTKEVLFFLLVCINRS